MDPLAQLKDIHLGQSYGVWPLAYGWWIAIVLVLLLLVIAVVYYKRRQQKRLAMRQALTQLKNLTPDQDWPQQLNQLLKRLSISYFPHEQVAGLHQQQWLHFLTRQLPAQKQEAFTRDYQLLLQNLYQKQPADLELAHYQQLGQQWIKGALPPGKKQRQEASHV